MPTTAWALVDTLILQGAEPDPALLGDILAAGEDAVGPLLELLRLDLDEVALNPGNAAYAARLLGTLGAADAAPLLLRYLRDGRSGELAGVADGLGFLGPDAAEGARALADDPDLPKERRAAARRALAVAGAAPDAASTEEALPTREGWLADYAASRQVTPAAEASAPAPRPLTPPPPAARPGRNEPCWCGSGKKYKACHWREDQRAGW